MCIPDNLIFSSGRLRGTSPVFGSGAGGCGGGESAAATVEGVTSGVGWLLLVVGRAELAASVGAGWVDGSTVVGRACAFDAQPASSAMIATAPDFTIENILTLQDVAGTETCLGIRDVGR